MYFTEDLHFRQDGTLKPETADPRTDTIEPIGTPLAAVLRTYSPFYEILNTDLISRIRLLRAVLRSFLEDLSIARSI